MNKMQESLTEGREENYTDKKTLNSHEDIPSENKVPF